jgi:hypothetical protein
MDVKDFAKILVETGEACGLDRDVYHHEIEKRAGQSRRKGQSFQQAYAKFLETEEGNLLFKAYKAAPVAKPEVQAPQDLRPEPAGPASKELESLAAFEAKSTGKSFAQSYTRLLTDPDRAELVRRVKQEELSATRMVQDSRWPLNEAERTSQTRDWVGRLDEVGRRRFRPNSQ